MAKCLIALGANLGDREYTLNTAVDQLAQHADLEVVSVSSWHSTRPIGGPAGQEEFLNGAALVKTSLEPFALLRVLQQIENSLGRTRTQHWAARTLDLDLLLVDDQVVDEPELQVPHPRMSFRRFVLTPAVEIAAEMLHPIIGRTLSQLLDHLDHSAAYIALAGPPEVGKTKLALALREKLGATLLCDDENLLPENIPVTAESPRLLTTEIELLQRRATQLEKAWKEFSLTPSGPLLVSDFALQQSLAYAKLWLPESEFQKFLDTWEQVFRKVTPPRLLISLETSPATLLQKPQTSQEESIRSSQVLRSAMKDAITGHCQGPLLQLDASDPQMVLTETLAAIAAMQA